MDRLNEIAWQKNRGQPRERAMTYVFRWSLAGAAALLAIAQGAAFADPPLLSNTERQQITNTLPSAPALESFEEQLDVDLFKSTRSFVTAVPGQPVPMRGQEAANDDVYDETAVGPRFADALGAPIDAVHEPKLLALMARIKAEGEAIVAPIKKDIDHGGRKRPFVQFPDSPTCLDPVDIAGHKDEDLNQYHLAASGSYPSTHALLGMVWGLVLADLAPDRAVQLIDRGMAFGDSREVCGFHYASDLTAGRFAAIGLIDKLKRSGVISQALNYARQEVTAAREGAKATGH
jgi:acid phosphatase (class A)